MIWSVLRLSWSPDGHSLRKQPTFREVALAKRRLSNERRNSILMTCTTQILVVLLIGCAAREFSFNQSEALPRSVYCTSSAWNFYARYSDVVLRGLKWRPRETSAVFSSYDGHCKYWFYSFNNIFFSPSFHVSRLPLSCPSNITACRFSGKYS